LAYGIFILARKNLTGGDIAKEGDNGATEDILNGLVGRCGVGGGGERRRSSGTFRSSTAGSGKELVVVVV